MEMDVGLNFIDYMEIKESLSDRLKVYFFDKKKMFFMEEMKNDMNGNFNTIKEGEDGGLEKDVS